MKLPNVYITREDIFVDGVKLPGVLEYKPIVRPGNAVNRVEVTFLAANVVVEGRELDRG